MTSRHPIRGWIELIGTRAACQVIPRWSRGGIVRLAKFLSGVAPYVAREARRVTDANLRLAYGTELDSVTRERIARDSFRTFLLVLLDLIWFTRDTAERIRQYVQPHPTLFARLERPGPAVLLTGHLGNWEVLGQAVALRGVPLMSVAAPLNNPAVDQILIQARRQSGQLIVPSQGALLRMYRHLRHGGKVAMLLDQNVKPEEGGVFVPFFGLPVPISTSAATLALRMRCPIISAYLLPQPNGIYRVEAGQTIEVDELPSEDTEANRTTITVHIGHMYERAIRKHPGHWLWSYKRWKHVPPEMSFDAYPFYAKAYRPPTRR